MNNPLRVGIVGGTGYTGVELMRLLAIHPQVEISVATSRGQQGTPVSEVYPNLRGAVDIPFKAPEIDAYADCDLVFFATPNGTAMQQAAELLAAGKKVIDLAADFRLQHIPTWEHWYGETHACPELVAEAVYGLPEINRQAIANARLVANPGCYPTSVILALLPLLKNGLIDPATVIADCKSGASGAGRAGKVQNLLCEITESVKAYGVTGHRHLPEIQQILRLFDSQADLIFTPHLMPMIRGIHSTVYATAVGSHARTQQLFEEAYHDEPFVDVMPAGSHPETRSVKGANHCRIALHYLPHANRYVVLSVIDNLVKGAAGQAVQNMNLMSGFPETCGLESLGLMP